MIIIGECINGTRKKVNAAIIGRDKDFIQNLARKQIEGGADYLDVNAGTNPEREPEDLAWLVNIIQEVTNTPLCLDSPNSQALQTAIKHVNHTPMINSISGETARLEGILPLVSAQKCPVIALALDDKGIPHGVEERMKVVRFLFEKTRELDIPDDFIYVDPLIMAISTDGEGGNVAIETMLTIKKEFPEAHLTGGMSNISFGSPARSLVNQTFMAIALYAGLDSAIIDPRERGLRGAVLAAEAVIGQDRFCMNYNKAYRSKLIG